MSAVTYRRPAVALPVRARVRHVVHAVRWAPAPYFEGTARQRLGYVAYVLGSMLAWTAVSLGVLALVGRALAAV